ncbi:MAG: PA14 domain-containing protein [Phycisphaerae bacterium]|nr:PA14 domain-containing protein [Tepidisphaeraceae bacterium]
MTRTSPVLRLALIALFAASAHAADKPAAKAKTKPAPAAPAPAAPAPVPPTTSPEVPTGPFGVPDQQSIARATKIVREAFRDLYIQATASAAGLPPRAALAKRLYQESRDTRDDNAARYVLLCEARDWAAKAAEPALACRAIDDLARLYAVAPGEHWVTALSLAARFTSTPSAHESLARAALSSADSAIARDEYDVAARLAALAETAARQAHKMLLTTDVADKVKEINWAKGEYERAKAAIETLASHPEDRDARAAAGRYKCLAKNDWTHGLPLLLESSDADYQRLAQRDVAAVSAGAAAQHEVGNEWWEWGEKLTGRARASCRNRAAYWYRLALPSLTGISRSTIERRLEDADLARLREQRLAPGLVGEYFAGQTFGPGAPKATRVDEKIDFDWTPATSPHEALPKDDFSIRWRGYLRVPASGKYPLKLIANQGARVFIDETLVIEDGNARTKGVTAAATLSEGLHPIRVDFWDGGGLARVRLFWTLPGGAEEPIPAKFLVHEIGAK